MKNEIESFGTIFKKCWLGNGLLVHAYWIYGIALPCMISCMALLRGQLGYPVVILLWSEF